MSAAGYASTNSLSNHKPAKRSYRDPRVLLPRNEIVRLYKAGRSLSEVAEELRIKRGRVEKVINEAGCARTMAEGVRLAKRGRPRRNFRHPAHPGEGPGDKWEKVKLYVVDRKSNQEIAKELHRTYPTIYWDLQGMGFPPGRRCYDFGEVFDRAALRRLHELSGLDETPLAKQMGIGFDTLDNAVSKRDPERQLGFNTALKAVQWRIGLYQRLMSGTGHYSQSQVIRTFFPNLREKYSLLLEVLHRLGHKLRENPEWQAAELQQFLCAEAMAEKSGRSAGDLCSRFLPWAPQVMAFLGQRLEALRGDRHQQLAWETIAHSLGTTAPIVSMFTNVARAKTIEPIPPGEMRALLLASAGANGQGQGRKAPKRGKRGPAREPAEAKSFYKTGTEVEALIPASLKDDRHAIIQARHHVADHRAMSRETVAYYHKQFRRLYKKERKAELPA